MMEILENTYPYLWMNYSEEFDGSEGGIWICAEGPDVDRRGDLLFSYYNEDRADREAGVLTHLRRWAERGGWFFEWNDPGTIFMWKIHND